MKNILSKLSYFALGLVGIILLSRLLLGGSFANAETINKPLPEFSQTSPQAWLNSQPLKKEDLLGKVALIDFWTFDCWNCYRSFPWLHDVEEKFKDREFQVIGIHSPEFEHEHERPRLEEKVAKYKLEHPIMMDNDFSYWKAMKNQYWPAFYLIDKKGVIRQRFIGETHSGGAQAKRIEAAIEQLLRE
jgi:alkyl hydroperoxide reductase subunit AhpC